MSSAAPTRPLSVRLLGRAAAGGVLMGLANLVPGISGGTMLLAAGVYPDFVDSIAAVTRLEIRPRPLVVLAAIGSAAGLAIVLCAGLMKTLVVDHRWAMYSLFIGLTLGGLPLVWRMARPIDRRVWIGLVAGFLGMAAIGVLQATEASALVSAHGPAMLLFAGVIGAAAMVLPGISGGYLLLLLGQYVPILSAIEEVRALLAAGDLSGLMGPILRVILPVGVGVAIGIAVVSNAVRFLLDRYRHATLGVLAGLLLGAVVGLFPFQRTVAPPPGGEPVDVAELPTETYRPTAAQVAASLGLILAGAATTAGLSRLSPGEASSAESGRGSV